MINLLDFRWDKYSSRGNDGIIRYILDKINIHHGKFVEFGAMDGICGSNCRRLFEEGWSGLFIESDQERFQQLRANYKDNNNIVCYNALVGLEGGDLFDKIVNKTIGIEIQFCSIDIDGLDLEVFETFREVLPDLICIEGGQMLHPDHKRVDKSIAQHNIQQSLGVMNKSFEDKGYKLLCTYQDSFFIKKNFFDLFDVSSNLMDLYFDGLKASFHRLPWIYEYVKKVSLKNPIIKDILQKTDYFNKYDWSKRKIWAKEQKDRIIKVIGKERWKW